MVVYIVDIIIKSCKYLDKEKIDVVGKFFQKLGKEYRRRNLGYGEIFLKVYFLLDLF